MMKDHRLKKEAVSDIYGRDLTAVKTFARNKRGVKMSLVVMNQLYNKIKRQGLSSFTQAIFEVRKFNNA